MCDTELHVASTNAYIVCGVWCVVTSVLRHKFTITIITINDTRGQRSFDCTSRDGLYKVQGSGIGFGVGSASVLVCHVLTSKIL